VRWNPTNDKFVCYQLIKPKFPLIYKGTKSMKEVFGLMRTLYCYCPSDYELSNIYANYEKKFANKATIYYKPFDYMQIKFYANNALLNETKGVQFDASTDAEISKIKHNYIN
jgi:hypothetical protein